MEAAANNSTKNTAHTDNATEVNKNTRGIWLTVFMIGLFITMVMVLFLQRFFTPNYITPEMLSNDSVRVLNQPRALALGELVSDSKAPVTTEFFQGQWTLAFFGFTHCPDICPMTLHEMNLAVKGLPDQLANETSVALISVDPARDTPEILRTYVQQFNDRFVGVTGDFIALKTFANSATVPFVKVPNTGPHAHHMPNAYTIDHGSQVVLINPNGDYHAYFKAPVNAQAIIDNLPAIASAFR